MERLKPGIPTLMVRVGIPNLHKLVYTAIMFAVCLIGTIFISFPYAISNSSFLFSREQSWVASGSFDRTIKLWDLSIACSPTTSSSAPTEKAKGIPIVALTPPDVDSPKSSVYALACDPFGRMIASGSPERVVRLWDPRTGKRTGAHFVF